jgi:hypothetical protein
MDGCSVIQIDERAFALGCRLGPAARSCTFSC